MNPTHFGAFSRNFCVSDACVGARGIRHTELTDGVLFHGEEGMTTTITEPQAQQVLLLLVDISGYTNFMVSHGKPE